MIPDSLLLTVALVEATLVGVTALVVLGSAMRIALRDRHRERKTSTIRGLVKAVEVEDPARAREALPSRTPGWLEEEAIAELLATLSGARRDRLLRLAVEGGMARGAERLCASRRWTRRLRGAHLLASLGLGHAILVELLGDEHPEVRAQAAEGAGDRPSPATVESLIDLLRDPAPLVRFAAKDALLRIGEPAAGPLAECLGQLPEEHADDALDVAIGLAGPRFLEPALRLRASRRGEVRARAARLLGAIGGGRATEALAGLLGDPDPGTRAAAAESLGRLGHWPASGALAARLSDAEWSVRRAAALALRDLGAPGLLFLRRAVTIDDRFARDVARQFLDLPEADDQSLAL